ncbi:hypothetical protein CERZMDRAFT_64690 [Cercospora zeae-maydis SCOH1-5]|uniref:Uncharacterized protein n=1 Tax=Cercospora zeae-maydis SCOH1-5 TaxID=717836 RepID=A0A6A6FS55_9PEZI|nr:hypothetical protein CERZMDRAFT_64690 [Cercospora zeae-maydis SCOH1-5]
MQWTAVAILEPSLPPHCVPQNDFLLRFSSTFHVCVPTPLAFLSNLLGALSIVAWLFAQLPQIYKNWSLQSTSGLSIFFLVEWCLGDLSNLLGALFTHQASWQVAIGAYYVAVDLCLVGQWIWYERLRHGHPVFRMWKRKDINDHDSATSGSIEQVAIEGMDARKPPARPRVIFRSPTFQRDQEEKEKLASSSGTPKISIYRTGPSSPMPSPSPRTMLFVACLIAMAHASPINKTSVHHDVHQNQSTPLENAGTIISWMSTLLYLGSRLPQLFMNWRRKSVAGLSPLLFMAAFCGNLFYSSALLTNPNAWNDFGPYGGGGWAGKEGSDRAQWVLAALPFFLGAAGVLGLDASVGVQFLLYGETEEKVVMVEEQKGSRWHWRRVSGWMRGWMPYGDASLPGTQERAALLEDRSPRGEAYGAL